MHHLRSIRSKILFGTGLALLVACGLLIAYSGRRLTAQAVAGAERQIEAGVDREAGALREALLGGVDVARGLAQVLGGIKDRRSGST